jgi:hypothetical protein
MGRSKGKKKRKPSVAAPYSSIAQHKLIGKKLIPPLNQLENFSPSSWRDDHAPEMLWALLLSVTFERRDYLACFREIAKTARPWFAEQDQSDRVGESVAASPVDPEKAWSQVSGVLDHTALAELDAPRFSALVDIMLRHPLGYAALRPLSLIHALPGSERWREKLQVEPADDDWRTLARAVAASLDHQSEQSTDVRWMKLIVPMISGNVKYGGNTVETAEAILGFPDIGDLRKVRPSIRSQEIMARRNPPSPWVSEFWTQTLEQTGCIDPTAPAELRSEEAVTHITATPLFALREDVIVRFFQDMSVTRADARLDSSFGFVLYALSFLEELASRRHQQGLVGRLILRTLVEAAVTLEYLAKKDDPQLWRTYRAFGVGQAKLAFLKAQEAQGELPDFVDIDGLEAIANEDSFQEFVDIDLGQWAVSNLRSMAADCDAKDIYDKYYGWTSTFVHAHWGAVRDSNFLTCQNPLHRLHRIPRSLHRNLENVEQDVVDLTDRMLGVLNRLYPSETPIASLRSRLPPAAPDAAQ